MPALFKYTNGCASRVGTIRSMKPSLLMSPQTGLPHDCFGCETNPTLLDTSVNCWAGEIEEKAMSNPATIAKRNIKFLTVAIVVTGRTALARKTRFGDRCSLAADSNS